MLGDSVTDFNELVRFQQQFQPRLEGLINLHFRGRMRNFGALGQMSLEVSPPTEWDRVAQNDQEHSKCTRIPSLMLLRSIKCILSSFLFLQNRIVLVHLSLLFRTAVKPGLPPSLLVNTG